MFMDYFPRGAELDSRGALLIIANYPIHP